MENFIKTNLILTRITFNLVQKIMSETYTTTTTTYTTTTTFGVPFAHRSLHRPIYTNFCCIRIKMMHTSYPQVRRTFFVYIRIQMVLCSAVCCFSLFLPGMSLDSMWTRQSKRFLYSLFSPTLLILFCLFNYFNAN